MRKTKLITLLLAITMLLMCIPVSAAYDPTTGGTAPVVSGIPADEWILSTVYHWVVRGETLGGIAARYGTNIDEIKFYNSEYFEDLDKRNTTLGIDRELEHGVRLKMYDQVTVIHYVQRGETLGEFANGYFVNGSFTIYTTKDAIRAENYNWFNSLAKLNETRNNPGHELEESYDFWNIWHVPYYGEDTLAASFSTQWGTPLWITVPVQLKNSGRDADPLLPILPVWGTSVNGKATDWYDRERHYYMANNGEKFGNPGIIEPTISSIGYVTGPQVPFPNYLPTNELLPANTGWTRAIYGIVTNPWAMNYKILGFYGARAEVLGGVGAWF